MRGAKLNRIARAPPVLDRPTGILVAELSLRPMKGTNGAVKALAVLIAQPSSSARDAELGDILRLVC